VRRILSIDGGGIKGVFPASFLATIEKSNGCNIANHFDMIVGTSTGGIIALALGLGFSAQDTLAFYEQHGPQIFSGNQWWLAVRRWLRAKYNAEPLAEALRSIFHHRRLGESTKRLVIPALNADTGVVHIWKTAHHERFAHDFRHKAVEVALSTAAAPTYFPTYKTEHGIPLLDGGMWANNPVAVAVTEAIGILKWEPASLRILSLGCTSTPLNINWGRSHSLGKLAWAKMVADVFVTAQTSSAVGMARHLIPNADNLIRISPAVGSRYDLDSVKEIASLRGLGATEARMALPMLCPLFFNSPVTDDFAPYHHL
jgi:uncharacterized protein